MPINSNEKSTAISLRIPNELLAAIKRIAERRGFRYQTLIKSWLIERSCRELLRAAAPEDRSGLKETIYLNKHFPDLSDRFKKSKTAKSRRRAVRAEDVGY